MKWPSRWKLKLALILALTLMSFALFLISNSGFRWMKARLVAQFQAMPRSEVRDSSLGKSWLRLAHFRGAVCGYDDDAMQMYREFLGVVDSGSGDFFKTGTLDGTVAGTNANLVSPDGLTGFGPLHPLAADAYSEYVEIYAPKVSGQYSSHFAMGYYFMLYEWRAKYAPDHKAHPEFRKHWYKFEGIIRSPGRLSKDFDYSIPLAPPWDDGSGQQKK